eukprot:2884368-Pyramimonas_sp.AAC.1
MPSLDEQRTGCHRSGVNVEWAVGEEHMKQDVIVEYIMRRRLVVGSTFLVPGAPLETHFHHNSVSSSIIDYVMHSSSLQGRCDVANHWEWRIPGSEGRRDH